MYIKDIKWPESNNDKKKILLEFMIDVVNSLKISFPEEISDPLIIAKQYLNDDIDELTYEKACETCWDYIDANDYVRDFKSRKTLLARLGLCLLSANKNLNQASEALAWFFEVLDYLMIDTEEYELKMQLYFKF